MVCVRGPCCEDGFLVRKRHGGATAARKTVARKCRISRRVFNLLANVKTLEDCIVDMDELVCVITAVIWHALSSLTASLGLQYPPW